MPLPPNFPQGLRVLLVDDEASRPAVEAQLRQPELLYAVTGCGSSAEALTYSRRSANNFDVVLAESKLVAADEVSGRSFINAFDETPVVLMSEGGHTEDVMRAVRLGAVDFLDKPLSVLKLKNIWQHSVRKMMQRTSLYDAHHHTAAAVAVSEPAPAPQQQASYSNCLPSAMTAPICPQGLGAAALHKSPSVTDTAGQANERPAPVKTAANDIIYRSSVDSPGTPSAEDQEPAEAASSGSGSVLPIGGAAGTTVDDVTRVSRASSGSFDEGIASADKRGLPAKQHQHIPQQWPQQQLAPGCVWGTPLAAPTHVPPAPAAHTAPVAHATSASTAITPASPAMMLLPPTLSSVNGPAPLLIKSRPASFDAPTPVFVPGLYAACAPAASAPPPLPEDFLKGIINSGRSSLDSSANKDGATARGPLGLKLRKSRSLLDLINSTLATCPEEGSNTDADADAVKIDHFKVAVQA